ncbi:uncharacterized protein LOC107223992 [Neodiprion lecontei]|uniref:Fibroblast growth factor n=1 Tax=Neodiprion lecontei TaxID=441921 RepID=A0A6J0BZ03_NEOLC|nr:uncharacterized protein LOC107223992 [Neodiprion lecontei]XP_046601516.1 uncharacterized protein LOC107223992 [Neodiprion lecontei]XP_046601517.1 uncharacterized protein LOC107223992 [Neodiprion lecontei]XP_046601518.1 uncharacterized protein LOC107223992 [Neodiprion lecontei]
MLALTYPDGSRVQRCDNLPERPGSPGRVSAPRRRAEEHRLLTWSSYNASRRRRTSTTPGDDGDRKERRDPRLPEAETTTLPSDDHPSTTPTGDRDRDSTRSSTSTKSSHPDDPAAADPRRFSPPVRTIQTRRSSSWSGAGPRAKDPCLLQVLLILVLLVIGCNRHCGPFGSKVNRTAFGALAIGYVIAGAGCAPVDILTDTGVRSERSANLSHITGTSRKIRMYVKNRYLQILPDGTVNGSDDDASDYTILQRASVAKGLLRIQGVATCLFLCMDSCGILYGSRDYTEDCVFNETLEHHNYNTYSSVRWSTARKTLYLGMKQDGQPRKVQTKGHDSLGRLSMYAKVLTSAVPQDRVEALQSRLLGARHSVRHHHRGRQKSICPVSNVPQERDGRDKFRCRKRKKRKKRRRRCRAGESPLTDNCDAREPGVETQSKRSCEGAAVEEACRREALEAPSKKRKSRMGEQTGPKKPRRKKNAGPSMGPKRNGGISGRRKPASRTTRTLGSSPAMTSPLSRLRLAPSTESSAEILRPPKPAAASLSAVSVAATSLASTLTLTLTSTTATALGIAGVDDAIKSEEIGDSDYIKTETLVDGNGFEDEDAEDEEREEDEEKPGRGDVFEKTESESTERLAM